MVNGDIMERGSYVYYLLDKLDNSNFYADYVNNYSKILKDTKNIATETESSVTVKAFEKTLKEYASKKQKKYPKGKW